MRSEDFTARCPGCDGELPPAPTEGWAFCPRCGRELLGAPRGTELARVTPPAPRFPFEREALLAYLREAFGAAADLYFPPLPARKERSVRALHGAFLEEGDEPLLVYDDTVFGSAREGFVLSARGVCWKNLLERPEALRWQDLDPSTVGDLKSAVSVMAAKIDVLPSHEALRVRLAPVLVALATAARRREAPFRGAGSALGVLAGFGGAPDVDAMLALFRDHLQLHPELSYRPKIPPRKESNARAVHAAVLPEDEPLLALYDATLFGAGDDGWILTPRRIAWRAFLQAPGAVTWPELKEVQVKVQEDKLLLGELPVPLLVDSSALPIQQRLARLLRALGAR